MEIKQPAIEKDREALLKLSKTELVELVLQQQTVLEQLVKEVEPHTCSVCGGHHFQKSAATVTRHVVAQLVEHPVEIVEYQQVGRICGQCGVRVSGELPEGIIPGQDLSARLQGMLAWLGHYGHLSYAKQLEWRQEFGKITVGTGTLEATTRRVATACQKPIETLKEWIRHQPWVHVDESPWLVKGVKEWLWTLSGEGYSFFHAGDTRSRAELEFLLGRSFTGTLISDD